MFCFHLYFKGLCREMCALPPFYLLFCFHNIVVVVGSLSKEGVSYELALSLAIVVESCHG